MRHVITIILVTLDYVIVLFLFHFESFLHGSTALIKVPVGSKPNNQSLQPFENHPTTTTLNQQTLNITNNNQTQTLHVTNKPPYTKHSKYKPRKPRTALVYHEIITYHQINWIVWLYSVWLNLHINKWTYYEIRTCQTIQLDFRLIEVDLYYS